MGFYGYTYRIENQRRIDGRYGLAFIHNDTYFVTAISVYQDGMIDCWGLINFNEFQEKVRSGWVATQIPPNADVGISTLARFRAMEPLCTVKPEEFIKEVADTIEALNDRPTSVHLCHEAYRSYKADPSSENLRRFQQAYEAIPEHNRRYILGDMDLKDWPLRALFYSTDIKEKSEALRWLEELWGEEQN